MKLLRWMTREWWVEEMATTRVNLLFAVLAAFAVFGMVQYQIWHTTQHDVEFLQRDTLTLKYTNELAIYNAEVTRYETCITDLIQARNIRAALLAGVDARRGLVDIIMAFTGIPPTDPTSINAYAIVEASKAAIEIQFPEVDEGRCGIRPSLPPEPDLVNP